MAEWPLPIRVPVRAVGKLELAVWEVRAVQGARIPAEQQEWEWVAVVAARRKMRFAANQPMAQCAPKGSYAAIHAEFPIATLNARSLVHRIHQVVRMAARFCPDPDVVCE